MKYNLINIKLSFSTLIDVCLSVPLKHFETNLFSHMTLHTGPSQQT
jgi:hypothetical protein